ncbi:MAG: UvrD-helicase domain-containing protein [Bacteroidota bacterium]
MNLKIISAGAGSGKTYRLTQEMTQLLKEGLRADGIIATTFTKKAAAELQERVRVKLLEAGMSEAANELTNALIGTVHGLGVKLLKRFAFEAGVSPEVDIMAEEDQQLLFNNSLATILTVGRIREMEKRSDRLGLNKKERYDWRREVRTLTDIARGNDFDRATLEKSKQRSMESFRQFLGKRSEQTEEVFNQRLAALLAETMAALEQNGDQTKVTQGGLNTLRSMANRLKLQEGLHWHEWVKLSKLKVGAKSRDDVAELLAFARQHDEIPAFHDDINAFVSEIFDMAMDALEEYEQYKKERGLIDYTDMEIQVKRLLDHPRVRSVLSEELDLLMVDEFQDTSPIQLEIFLKLSQIARHSIWVGDPKQSIYGFRGADPKLMLAIIEQNGGVKKEDIQEFSWRSREDIVKATNALFCKAFQNLPKEQIALRPKRTKVATAESANQESEPMEMKDALMHWHFAFEGEGKRSPGRPWMENCIAREIVKTLERQAVVFSKAEKVYRPIQPGDIAVLCRSNVDCDYMARALHDAGLKAAIARNGLLNTAESKLILACLKYILQNSDSLSVAEILLLAERLDIEEIIEDRLQFLERHGADVPYGEKWGMAWDVVQQLDRLRSEVVELSSAEILNLLLERLDLRRIIARWGKQAQRMANVDQLRRMALQYEDACNRLHTAASLGGFLLWINEQNSKGLDWQGAGQGADAVNVLTYHKSKGLEWPMVICHKLENRIRDNLWGFNIVADSEQVDLNNILGNRWLRYWINPYSDQIRNTALEERLNASPEKKAVHAAALAEEARLLYVGITRARDYLVFPTRKEAARWLNRTWHEGEEEYPVLDPASSDSPWEWEGEPLYIDTEVTVYPRDFTVADKIPEPLYFLEKSVGKAVHPAYFVNLKQENFRASYQLTIAKPASYSTAMKIPPEADAYAFAKAFKAFLAADHLEYEMDLRQDMARGLLVRYELDEVVDPLLLVRQSHAYQQFWTSVDAPLKIHRKYPVTCHFQQRCYETVVDLVLETSNGLVLVQNSGFSGPARQRKSRIKGELADMLYLASQALAGRFQTTRVQTFVHFVTAGLLMELKYQAKKRSADLSPKPDQLELF